MTLNLDSWVWWSSDFFFFSFSATKCTMKWWFSNDSGESVSFNSVQPFWNLRVISLLIKLWSIQATQMCHQRDIYSDVASISTQLSRGQYPGQKHVLWTWCNMFCANTNMVHIHIQMGTCQWCAEMFTASILSWCLTGWSPKVLHFVWFIASVHSPEEGGTSSLENKQRRQCTNSACNLAEQISMQEMWLPFLLSSRLIVVY